MTTLMTTNNIPKHDEISARRFKKMFLEGVYANFESLQKTARDKCDIYIQRNKAALKDALDSNHQLQILQFEYADCSQRLRDDSVVYYRNLMQGGKRSLRRKIEFLRIQSDAEYYHNWSVQTLRFNNQLPPQPKIF